ncbi:TetR/AcrR family transcriptional regulator [Actinomycetospora sp. CA-084318]|uniref:TetR/AcrR family transcriptional regulator n=1 Tax=Actinomycetospora sp. CA-084318 TaxID=3239892 RepID=UPI003D98F91B
MPRPRQFDEDRVLSAVRTAFWDHGYAGTSLETLLAASGLGKGSLYGAFGDKHRLFLRILRDYDEANDRMLRDRLAHAERGVDVLRDFVLGAVGDPAGEHARRGCLLANSAVELSATAPDVAAEARRSYTATTAVLADAVRRAQFEGDVARDADPDEVARTVLAGQLGLVVLGRIGEDPGVLATLAGALLDRLLPA